MGRQQQQQSQTSVSLLLLHSLYIQSFGSAQDSAVKHTSPPLTFQTKSINLLHLLSGAVGSKLLESQYLYLFPLTTALRYPQQSRFAILGPPVPVPTTHLQSIDMAPVSYGPKDMDLNVQFADVKGTGGVKLATMSAQAYNKACREWNVLIKRFNDRGQTISRHEGLISKLKHDFHELDMETFALRAEQEDRDQQEKNKDPACAQSQTKLTVSQKEEDRTHQYRNRELEFAKLLTQLALSQKEANDEKERASALVEIIRAREETNYQKCQALQAEIESLKARASSGNDCSSFSTSSSNVHGMPMESSSPCSQSTNSENQPHIHQLHVCSSTPLDPRSSKSRPYREAKLTQGLNSGEMLCLFTVTRPANACRQHAGRGHSDRVGIILPRAGDPRVRCFDIAGDRRTLLYSVLQRRLWSSMVNVLVEAMRTRCRSRVDHGFVWHLSIFHCSRNLAPDALICPEAALSISCVNCNACTAYVYCTFDRRIQNDDVETVWDRRNWVLRLGLSGRAPIIMMAFSWRGRIHGRWSGRPDSSQIAAGPKNNNATASNYVSISENSLAVSNPSHRGPFLVCLTVEKLTEGSNQVRRAIVYLALDAANQASAEVYRNSRESPNVLLPVGALTPDLTADLEDLKLSRMAPIQLAVEEAPGKLAIREIGWAKEWSSWRKL
jgi:hypothetical protein